MSAALLLAEPEPFLERHLRSDGFQVVDDAARPDLVLLADTAALEEYRARHGDVPVIVLGDSRSDAVDRVRALERGCDDFLVRPFTYEELLARIRAVRGARRRPRTKCAARARLPPTWRRAPWRWATLRSRSPARS